MKTYVINGLTYTIGNLIEMADNGKFHIAIHGANAFNTMGAGLAAQLAKRSRKITDADNRTIKGDRSKLGTYTKAVIDDIYTKSVYTVINAYTQYTYWDVDDMLSYDAVRQALTAVKEEFDSDPDDIPRIGIPLIGAGLAHGNWNVIEKIIKDVGFRDLTIVVFNEDEAKRVNRTPT